MVSLLVVLYYFDRDRQDTLQLERNSYTILMSTADGDTFTLIAYSVC